MFRRAKSLVGLDIGSSAVKAVELKPAGRGYRIATYGSEALPPDSIVDGAIIDGTAVADAIRRLFEAAFVMVTVALLAFVLFRFVGDPVNQMVGQDTSLEDRQRLRLELGLDDPRRWELLRAIDVTVTGDQVTPVSWLGINAVNCSRHSVPSSFSQKGCKTG